MADTHIQTDGKAERILLILPDKGLYIRHQIKQKTTIQIDGQREGQARVIVQYIDSFRCKFSLAAVIEVKTGALKLSSRRLPRNVVGFNEPEALLKIVCTIKYKANCCCLNLSL